VGRAPHVTRLLAPLVLFSLYGFGNTVGYANLWNALKSVFLRECAEMDLGWVTRSKMTDFYL
jgi:hypothetical protein